MSDRLLHPGRGRRADPPARRDRRARHGPPSPGDGARAATCTRSRSASQASGGGRDRPARLEGRRPSGSTASPSRCAQALEEIAALGGAPKDLETGPGRLPGPRRRRRRSTSAGSTARPRCASGTASTRATRRESRSDDRTARSSSTSSTRWSRFDRERLPEIDDQRQGAYAPPPGTSTRPSSPSRPRSSSATSSTALRVSWQEAERLRNETHREVAAPERFAMLVPPPRPRSREAARPRPIADAPRHAHARAVEGRRVPAPITARSCAALRRALPPRRGVELRLHADGPATCSSARASSTSSRRSSCPTRSAGASRSRDHLRAALAGSGVTPADALFVGDRIDIDVAGAQEIGMEVGLDQPRRRAAAAGRARRPTTRSATWASSAILHSSAISVSGRSDTRDRRGSRVAHVCTREARPSRQ